MESSTVCHNVVRAARDEVIRLLRGCNGRRGEKGESGTAHPRLLPEGTG